MALTEVEAAWLAGLLEGDGCFALLNNKTNDNIARIELGMSDKDVVEKAAKLLGGPVSKGILTKGGKQMWHVKTAKRENVKALLPQLLPHMGKRRAEKIRILMAAIEAKESNHR